MLGELPLADLNEETIVQHSTPSYLISGVYFLIYRDRVVYVGQAKSIFNRLCTHMNDKSKKFDRIAFMPTEPSSAHTFEMYFIRKFLPLYNRQNKELQPYGLSYEDLKPTYFRKQESDGKLMTGEIC